MCGSAEAEIRDLMHRYAELFDGGKIDEFADLFARGTLHFRGLDEPCIGSQAVRDFIDRRVILYDGRPRTNHVVTNILVEVDPAGSAATARSYVIVLQATPELPLQPIVTGRYHDVFAHDASTGWHFVEREARGGLRGDISHHLRPKSHDEQGHSVG